MPNTLNALVYPNITTLQSDLINWYKLHQRSLPWRNIKNPYFTLVSELMLQQTQVKTVLPYFKRFVSRFPTISDLAKADLGEVYKLWEGLGYYRRAKLLHQCAVYVTKHLNGELPATAKELIKLPGIGPYTAGAVASIAFGEAVPCIDGNVKRVLTRLYAEDGPIENKQTQKLLHEKSTTLVPFNKPGDFNQALMELGALICKPKNPDCKRCPWEHQCLTKKNGEDPNLRPNKEKKIKVRSETYYCHVLETKDSFFMVQRPKQGLLANLWEFPNQIQPYFFPFEIVDSFTVRHRFTHIDATYDIRSYHLPKEQGIEWPGESQSQSWIPKKNIANFALTKTCHKILAKIV